MIYKIISKILVNRLKPFIDQLITPYQNAFIKGRSIIDNILIACEIFDLLRKKKGWKNCFGALKIDISKACDRVDWKFLKAVLLAMNFSPWWIGWVMECVSTVQFTLLVNGSMTQTFNPSKGLRQGDPMSPYLFLMCANVLSPSLLKAEHNKDIQDIKVGRMDALSLTYFLLMTLCFSLKKITDPLLTSKISCIGTVPYQGKASICPS